MNTVPLLLRLQDFVLGNGFLAEVRLNGRAILLDEGVEGLWIDGVQPNCIAGGDLTIQGAVANFQRHWRSVLFDIVAESSSLEVFKQHLRQLFDQVDETSKNKWETALLETRAYHGDLLSLPVMNKLEDLPTLRSEQASSLTVSANPIFLPGANLLYQVFRAE